VPASVVPIPCITRRGCTSFRAMDERTKVFISYRRRDDPYVTGLVRDKLALRLGAASVFLDEGSIPPGVDFAEHIRSALAATDVVLALIGPHWQPELLARPDDFVRLELATALALRVIIIPVLHSDQHMPDPLTMPPELRCLTRLNAFTLGTVRRYHDDLEELARYVVSIGRRGRERQHQGVTMPPPPPRQRNLDFINETSTTTAIRAAWRRVRGGAST
jgi:hypothetical protein